MGRISFPLGYVSSVLSFLQFMLNSELAKNLLKKKKTTVGYSRDSQTFGSYGTLV
jgi:hypothetical protein